MATVVALSRYPVKGCTPEPVQSLLVQDDGRISGDRVLAFRFADAVEPEDRDGLDSWPKAGGLSLQDFPALAELRLEYAAESGTVRLSRDGRELVQAGLDAAGRLALEDAVTEFVLTTPEAKRLQRPGRLPLKLLGDGITSRFQDRARGYISVHSSASVQALSTVLDTTVDDRRFRSNIVIDGVPAEAELAWLGPVTIGGVEFAPQHSIVRCLATHANPDTGKRDLRILTTLTQQLGQQEPTLGRLLLPTGSGGEIHVGDKVSW